MKKSTFKHRICQNVSKVSLVVRNQKPAENDSKSNQKIAELDLNN